MKIKFTNELQKVGINFCVYGEAGIGKTTLCSTAPRPLIISAEGGLLSLSDHKIPVVEIQSRKDCDEVYDWLTMSEDAKAYDTICIDSLSEIAEVLLTEYKRSYKDARQAYGEMNDDMAILIRAFRDLSEKHVYFSCKIKRLVDEKSGLVSFIPSVPGNTLLQSLPFFFDELFVMRMGKLEDGSLYRYLQTTKDLQYEAKDRSGKLSSIVKPNIAEIITQITGEKNGTITEKV